ncbi:MAG: DUF1552 domain-containing protein [Myxococcales bacterium]|nr:DUF1552 domain-containing protein [Myxococcales bacterium]
MPIYLPRLRGRAGALLDAPAARLGRRTWLKGLTAAALGVPLWRAYGPTRARAAGGAARRVIFFYYPDGVVGPSQDGQPTMWHCSGGEHDFALSPQLEPLAALKGECLFFNGLTMGPADSGSHPGGAKKLLTAVDGGFGESIDQLLARTVGADAPYRHLYLGAQANQSNASGDKHVSYPSPGQSVTPQDDPREAFSLLFGDGGGDGGAGGGEPDPTRVSVIDGVLEDMNALRAELGETERGKLDLHLDALREVEQRIKQPGAPPPGASCDAPTLDTGGLDDQSLYAPERFPDILRAQTDLMVLAMACGLTRVGVIQASHHTSELIMSRFAGSEMYDPGYDMRSHQASHYGASHNPESKEFSSYLAQRRWWVAQFAYLLEQLAARPDEGGTMLDSSLVVLCTEVCDGNTHLHDNMPFVLAGRGGGTINPGRLLVREGSRHADLWIALAHAMGEGIGGFGDVSSGPLSGVLS